MDAEPVKEAADPAREAEKAPPTFLHGTLTVEVPGGETMVLKTTFDSGSNTDAVSEKVAIQLKKLGGLWQEDLHPVRRLKVGVWCSAVPNWRRRF